MKLKLLLFLLIGIINLFPQPKEETRSVWITTVFNLDWPLTSGQTSQKSEFISYLNQLKQANFNTIMIQVRARGSLIYPSQIEPWARAMTGVIGSNPGWDPLQFIITEAKARGFEVHAWWNVYHAYGNEAAPNTNPPHVTASRPDIVKRYTPTGEWWLDPGNPNTRTYLLNLAMEMIRNYDIDAIHFDYIRYPNPDFPDDDTYQLYGQGINKNDWRRNSITQFVSALYDSVQAVKPNIKVGSAPIGIYRNLSSCNSSSFNGLNGVFQDARRWLLLRKHDYHSPQVYWDINSCPRFDSLAIDWINNSNNRHIYTGIATYRMASTEGNWPASEILAQIDSSRKFGGQGQTFFRLRNITSNLKGIYDLLRNNHYKYPANIPSMAWKDSTKPNAPVDLSISTSDSLTFILKWSKPAPAVDGDTAFYFNVYRDTINPVNTDDIKNVIAFRVVNDTSVSVIFNSVPDKNYYFVVTAYDRNYNESFPSNQVGIIVTNLEEENLINNYLLEQNYPNPFNPVTKISYSIGIAGETELVIYDILGNKLITLVNEFQSAGNYSINFDTTELNLSSGVYFYTLKSGEFLQSKKLTVLK